MNAEVELSYALTTLRAEFYRLETYIRDVPEECFMRGGPAVCAEARNGQKQIVEALLILGADVTPDMQALKPESGP